VLEAVSLEVLRVVGKRLAGKHVAEADWLASGRWPVETAERGSCARRRWGRRVLLDFLSVAVLLRVHGGHTL
jgi:hypothetical protein